MMRYGHHDDRGFIVLVVNIYISRLHYRLIGDGNSSSE